MSATLPLKAAWFPACVPPREDPVAQAIRMKMADSQIRLTKASTNRLGGRGGGGGTPGGSPEARRVTLSNHITTRLEECALTRWISAVTRAIAHSPGKTFRKSSMRLVYRVGTTSTEFLNSSRARPGRPRSNVANTLLRRCAKATR